MAKKKTAKKAAVVKVDEVLSPAESKKLDEAVVFINGRADSAAISIIEIGQYLLKHFFQDDADKVRDRAGRKGVSLRKLAEHPDVAYSYSALSRAVSLAVQEKQLATVATSQQLTASHKVLLFSVDSIPDIEDKKKFELKKKYIAQIDKEKLSVRAFQDLLVKDGIIKPRGLAAIEDEGERKRLRSGIHKLTDPFESILGLEIDKFSDVSPANLRSAYQSAKKARDHLEEIIADLEARLK